MTLLTNDQESTDAFYWQHGPCCAGCDWWARLNSVAGECRKSAPVAEKERFAMVGIDQSSLHPGADHIVTTREHHCGDFKDDFDWTTLPLAYRKRVRAV